MAAIQKNILEHISIMAQEQVQLEFQRANDADATDATDGCNESTDSTTVTNAYKSS